MSEQEPIYKSFDDKAYEGPSETEAAGPPPTALTLDDLHDREVDVAGARAVQQRALPPSATYETDPDENGPMNVAVAIVPEKRGGALTGTSRTVITLSGRATAFRVRGEDGEVSDVPTGIRFKMSPDVRRKVDWETQEETDKDDIQTKLWAQAVTVYQQAIGDEPKSQKAVVEYLRDNAARYRLIQTGVATKSNPEPRGEPGTMVVAIQVKRPKQG